MTSNTDMPARIWALPESELTGPYTTSPIWSDLPLNTSFVLYVRADLVKEAVEVLESAAFVECKIVSEREVSVEAFASTEHLAVDVGRRARAALSKLKEAGL